MGKADDRRVIRNLCCFLERILAVSESFFSTCHKSFNFNYELMNCILVKLSNGLFVKPYALSHSLPANH